MSPRIIAIIGLGLMGGSLAAACRRKFPHSRIVGVSRKKQALQWAQHKRWIHEGTIELKQGVANADVVVLCTPVDTFRHYLHLLDRYAKPGVLVTDVGSVKGNIRREIENKRWKKIRFVSAHPMVGSHEQGIRAASPFLYDQGLTFLIRSKRADSKSYVALKQFWKKICVRVVEVSLEGHDRIVSEISHLPHLLAVCLVLSVPRSALRFAASGFRDTTRIAQGHPSLWLPILWANRREIKKAMAFFRQQIQFFERACQSDNTRRLSRMLHSAMSRRSQI